MILKLFYYLYVMLRWLLLGVLFIALLLLFLIEKPSVTLDLTKDLLAEQNISYDKIEGGLLSGFTLTDVHYNNHVKASEVTLKVDIEQLRERILHIEDITLEGVEIDQAFLTSLIDTNSSKEASSENTAELPFKRLIVDRANLGVHNITYQEYRIDDAQLHIKNLTTDLKQEYRGDMMLHLTSNVGKADLNSTVDNQKVNLTATLIGEKSFLNPLLQEQNITLTHNPHITIHAQGESERDIDYKLIAHQLDLNYAKEYILSTQQLTLSGNYNIPKKNLQTTLDTQLGGNMADLKLLAKTKLNTEDINKTLQFDLRGQLTPKAYFLKTQLSDQNITLLTAPIVDLNAKGTLKQANFETTIRELGVKQGDIIAKIPSLTLKGETDALQGDTKLVLNGTVDSSAGEGKIEATSSFNFNRLEESLTFTAQTDLNGNAAFLNTQLKEELFTLSGSPKIKLEAKGSFETIIAQINANADLTKETVTSPLTLTTTPVTLSLKTHRVDGEVILQSSAQSINIDLKSRFQGDYTQPQALETNTHAKIRHLNAFGVNLESIVPLTLSIQNNTSGANAVIDSPHIQLHAQTRDYDQLNFTLNTGNLYPYKMVTLPPEFEEKFIKLDLKGNATLSQQFFTLKGMVASNNRFKAMIDAHNNTEGLHAKLTTKSLHATVQGDLKNRDITASIETQSVKAVQKEINTLYPFSIVEVNGALRAEATVKGESIQATVTTPKLKFKSFNVEKVDIDVDYSPERIALHKLNFTTSGFADKQLNQAFYLNQPGIIHLAAKRDILIDMHPNIKIVATGDANSLSGTAKINALPLGYPDYGSGQLSTDILFKQEGLKRRITGDITLKKLKLFYEAKFLEADYDPDVMIITKKDKLKKEQPHDTFIEDTLIDLKVNAPKAKYKTADIGLDFDVNLKVQKAFGKEIALLGKIKDIEGHVDQVPKRFTVKESNIVFTGEKKINPLLDIYVEYELPQVLIGIKIGGNANRPKLDFTSDPTMPKKDILSYLLFGVSTANLAEGEGSLSHEAELFIINQAARDFATEFDLDRVLVKDDGTGEGYAVEAGKNISKNNMFIIESSKVGNSYILERKFNQNLKLRVGQHQKEQPSQSIDLYFRKRFK